MNIFKLVFFLVFFGAHSCKLNPKSFKKPSAWFPKNLALLDYSTTAGIPKNLTFFPYGTGGGRRRNRALAPESMKVVLDM